MKKPALLIVSPLACGAVLLCFALNTGAQQRTGDVNPANPPQQQSTGQAGVDRLGQLDDVTAGPNIRASQLIGMNIENPKGEGVGEVKDLVIDGKSGKIRYAAVTYGGFLGIGNKMFAVPFEAFQVRTQRDDPDDYVLTLDVSQERLEGATGFDEDHWPNFADQNFTNEVDRRYGIDRRANRERIGQREVDVNIRRNGTDVDINKNRGNQ